MLRRFWRPETGIFLAIWMVLMVAGRSRLFQDPGTFWHTAVGERLLTTGFFETDPYSFTRAGETWIPNQWLAECGMALLYRLGQFDSQLLAAATLLAALYTWVAHRLMRGGLHWLLAGFLTALVLGASGLHFHVRPHLATIVLLGVTFALLCDWEAGRIPRNRLLWLLPLFLLWTNLHGGMLGGLMTLGLAVAGWCLGPVLGFDARRLGVREMLFLGALVAGCGLTAFVTPYGPRLFQAWRRILEVSVMPRIIVEHMPLNPFAKPEEWGIVAVAGIYLATLLGTWPRRPRVTWILPLFWLYQAVDRVRHGPLFCLVAMLAVAEMLPYTRWALWLARRGDLYTLPAQGSG
jgi:hypothetical protein